MPSGKTHLRIEGALLVFCSLGATAAVTRHVATVLEVQAFVAAYVFSMLFLSPDLDLTSSDSTRRWGPLRWLWIPYALVFRHRRTSHHLVLGPLTRIAYLGLLGFAAALSYAMLSRHALPEWALSERLTLAILVGLYLPNAIHILADTLQSFLVRLRRRL